MRLARLMMMNGIGEQASNERGGIEPDQGKARCRSQMFSIRGVYNYDIGCKKKQECWYMTHCVLEPAVILTSACTM